MYIVPVHGLLEYPKKNGFRPILGWWRSILWRFSAIFRFDATTGRDLPETEILRRKKMKAHLLSSWNPGYFVPRKVTRFSWNPPIYTIVTPYPLLHIQRSRNIIRTHARARVQGLGSITWRMVLTKKLRGHLRKKLHGNREIAGEWAVGLWVHRDSWLGA